MNFHEFLAEFQKFDNKDSNEVNMLIESVKPLLSYEPSLIKIKNGFKSIIVGDIHGDIKICVGIIKEFFESNYNYLLFLGDYVDRGFGDMQIALVNLLLHLKRLFPQKVYLLRGNHEWSYINAEYGFKEAVYHHLNPLLFQRYNELFNEFPLAIKIEEPKILVVHGGIPISNQAEPYDISIIELIPKRHCFSDKVGQQILWNDPSDKEVNYKESDRGLGYIFGEKPFLEFMEYNSLNYCIRSHEICKNGHNKLFNDRLITIFSSRNCGKKVKPHILMINDKGDFEFKEIIEEKIW